LTPSAPISTENVLVIENANSVSKEESVTVSKMNSKQKSQNKKSQKKTKSDKKSNDKKKNKKKSKKNNARKSMNKKQTQKQQEQARREAEQEISLEEQSKYLALDCEMVGVGEGGSKSALARVSIVDYNNAIVFDTYVKVNEPVTDYRTFVSGIREEHLSSDMAMDFAQCQSIVKKVLQGKILIGHALKNDMAVLEFDHPWYDCRDTAKYEPFMKKDKNTNILRPRKLKDLTETKLNRMIQLPGHEHCPIEDAIAALDLYKKARIKWEKAMSYKSNRTREIENEHTTE
jgi:RNA exonuclease 4